MPQPCATCTSPNRDAINKALVAGTPRYRVARRYGMSETSLRRHESNHLPEDLAKAQAAAEVLSADSLLEKLSRLEADVSAVMEQAKEAENPGAILQTVDRQVKVLALLVRAAESLVVPEPERPFRPSEELGARALGLIDRIAAGEFGEVPEALQSAIEDVKTTRFVEVACANGRTLLDIVRDAAEDA